ncbi:MAG: ATP-binding protein [Candidatus Edwardsbacteria bacterium]|jgi:MinD superfamily P-loop ATPase|nr:ATP-binding protein [Candidatus Edwardsbacteria bacterium]
MILAVASGKGGTGKTTIAVNLARTLGSPVQVADCDVEEPNAHLFLPGTLREQHIISTMVPEIDAAKCDCCGECGRFCQYHAIAAVKPVPMVFAELCHGCGGCVLVCPKQAVSEAERRIGVVETVDAGDITLVQGRLDVGVSLVPPLIRAVKSRLAADRPAILDAPPGTSCSVVATLRGAQYVLLVTEPTPFGLHDLTLAVDLVRELKLPFGVVVNRAGSGDDRGQAYCREQGIPILAEIPDDRRIAEAYSRGELMVDALPDYRTVFTRLWQSIRTGI